MYYIDTTKSNDKTILDSSIDLFNQQKTILQDNQIRLNFYKYSDVSVNELISDQEYFNNFNEVNINFKNDDINEFLFKYGYSIERPGYIDLPIDNFNYYMALRFISENINKIISNKTKFLMFNRNLEKIKESILKKFKIASISYDLYDVNVKNDSKKLDENRFLNNIMNIITAVNKVDDILNNYFKNCKFNDNTISIVIHKNQDSYQLNKSGLEIFLNFDFDSEKLLEFLSVIKLKSFNAI